MSDPTDKDLPDEQLEEYLRGGSDVSRQYRQLHGADVPAVLDRLVLRQAQEAVKSRPAKSRAWMRWSGPLALAASVVLVVSIVIESGVQDEVYLAAPVSAPVESKVLRESAEEPVERTASGPGAPARASAKASEENSAGESVEESAQEYAQESARDPEFAFAQDQAAAGEARGPSVVRVVPEDHATVSPRFVPAPIPPADPPQARVPEQASARAIAPAAPMVAPQPESQPPAAPDVEMPSADLERQAHAEPTATTAQKRAADKAEYDISEVAVTSSTRHRSTTQRRATGPRNTVAVPAEPADSAAAQEDESRSYADPEQWLQHIRELRKQKKHEDADREWRRFRSVFPNYTVDETDLARGAAR